MADTELSIEELAGVYLKIRSTIEEKEDQHKAAIQELKDQLDMVGNKLLGVCNSLGTDSLRTSAGTVTRRVSSRYWTSDWESMYQFIKQHDAHFLLEQRIHTANMRQFLEENPDKLPMGLQNERKYTVQVRKPTAK